MFAEVRHVRAEVEREAGEDGSDTGQRYLGTSQQRLGHDWEQGLLELLVGDQPEERRQLVQDAGRRLGLAGDDHLAQGKFAKSIKGSFARRQKAHRSPTHHCSSKRCNGASLAAELRLQQTNT